MYQKNRGFPIALVTLVTLVLGLSSLIAPPTPGIQICVACGSYWIPDPSGGPSKPCEDCFEDIGPALGCLEFWPDSDGCSSCSDLAYGDCDL